MFEFAWPWLFVLVPLPWVVRQLLSPLNSDRQRGMKVPFIRAIGHAVEGVSSSAYQSRRLGLILLAYLAWFLLLAAAARPQWLGEPVPQQLEGRDMMLAIDLSESMQEQDFQLGGQLINRLVATKVVAGDFVERREGDRVGLILFGEQAYLQAPLTRDLKTVKQLLNEAQIGLAGQRTAIGDAIGLAVKRFKEGKSQQRVLVLLTDGTTTAGVLSPNKAAELAAAEDVTVYTIGIGRDSSQVDLLRRFLGRGGSPEIDEAALKNIAEKTGGRYFRATDLQQLSDIYAELDKLEPVDQGSDYYRPIISLYQWPLLGGILALCLVSILQRRKA
ncbi:vWA domain-containing protein [Neptunomonas phycophila]|uniref:vWA domain-containing protein n=1 Tax=Neptunomonas phycophila TaxID=1572645 RepID=UPI001BE8C28D|nr:VWA domain-containing protein [Neptunomonas phycophila]MBT3146485.1 VWA domain-containing protein [Neptunomonas phycophila]